MSSQLGGVIAALRRGDPLRKEAVDEIERTLDALRDEGWSGSVAADEAVKMLAEDDE